MPSSLDTSALVDLYGDNLWRFCLKLTYSKEDAEDLFQETFLKTISQLPKVNASANPKGFLFSTAVFLWKSKQRLYARRARLVPIEPLQEHIEINGPTNIENEFIEKEENALINSLVEKLPDKLRIPILLHYNADMAIAEIAQTLEIPVGTVKSRLHKARKTLEKQLAEVCHG